MLRRELTEEATVSGEQTQRKVCVILGAGASWDVRNEGSQIRTEGLRPPFARELFHLEGRGNFRPIIAEYEGAVTLAQGLASKSTGPNFDLEKELRRIAEHPSGLMREHYKHVPPYLRDLLMKCSYQYTAYPSCYIRLVEILLAEVPSDVLFLVLNYDDLLEQALYRFSTQAIRFESMDDYMRAERPVKVVKLHGSINWFKLIVPANVDWKTLVKNSDVLAKPEDGNIYVAASRGKSDTHMTFQIEIERQRAYPILTAPLAGKGATAAVCPAAHLKTAREFLSVCDRFLIIGCSGIDDDLFALMSESVRADLPQVQVVSGSRSESEKVFQKFASKGAFGPGSQHASRRLFDGGFQSFVAGDAPVEFLSLP